MPTNEEDLDDKKHTAAKVGKAKTDRDIKLVLAEHVTAIRRLGKQTVANIIEIGRRLTECKDIFGPRGGFNSWIDNHFGWSERHARNFMHVYELAESKSENFSELKLPISAFYLLAAPSTPEPVRDEIITRAKGGEKIKHAEVKKRVAKARPPTKRSSPAAKASSSPAAKAVAEAAEATARKREAAAQAQQDVGSGSSSELQRKLARLEELENANRVQAIKIIGLEADIEDLKARSLAAPSLQAAIELLIERAHHTIDSDYALPANVTFDAKDFTSVIDHLRKLKRRKAMESKPVETAAPAPVPAVTAPPSAPVGDGLDIPMSLRREVTKH